MKPVVFAIGVATMFITCNALAVPSPVVNMPLDDWNFGNEPALKGGAKYMEEVDVRNGTPSESKYIISLDSNGNYAERKLVTDGSDKTYVTVYERDDAGNLESVTQTIVEGDTSRVNSRQTATYKDDKLSAIATERCLTQNTLQPESTVTVETAADGRKMITIANPGGETQMTLTLTYGENGRFTKMAMTRRGRTLEGTVERNADGLVTKATNDRIVTDAVYEMDEKGNWTKAVITTTIGTGDGKERKRVREVGRKIVY